MTHSDDFAARESLALKECQRLIDWYDQHGQRSRVSFRAVQLTAVALSAVTPVLLIADLPKWFQGLPAATAAVLGVLITTMQWRENWARFAASQVALNTELLRYQTRAIDRYAVGVDDEKRLAAFVAQVTTIEEIETQEWQRALETSAKTHRPDADSDQAPRNPAPPRRPP